MGVAVALSRDVVRVAVVVVKVVMWSFGRDAGTGTLAQEFVVWGTENCNFFYVFKVIHPIQFLNSF